VAKTCIIVDRVVVTRDSPGYSDDNMSTYQCLITAISVVADCTVDYCVHSLWQRISGFLLYGLEYL